MADKMLLTVLVPAYNEEETIGPMLDKLIGVMKFMHLQDYEIIVVNDASADRTLAIAQQKGVKVISHEINKGYGASLKTGIRNARFKYILIIDADDTYPADKIPLLISKIGEDDMAVGARTGRNVNIPVFRRPAKAILNLLANYLTETKIPDLNSGFRIIKKEAALKFFHILPNGFSFTTTITLVLLVNNYSVVYIPIEYFKRKGRSKFHPVKDTFNYFLLIIRTIMYFNPLKIFLPLSFLLFLTGIVILCYSYFFIGKVMDVATILCIVTAIQTAVIGLLADLIDKRLLR